MVVVNPLVSAVEAALTPPTKETRVFKTGRLLSSIETTKSPIQDRQTHWPMGIVKIRILILCTFMHLSVCARFWKVYVGVYPRVTCEDSTAKKTKKRND